MNQNVDGHDLGVANKENIPPPSIQENSEVRGHDRGTDANLRSDAGSYKSVSDKESVSQKILLDCFSSWTVNDYEDGGGSQDVPWCES